MDRLLLIAATLCFLTSFGYTLYALGPGGSGPDGLILSRFSWALRFNPPSSTFAGKRKVPCPLNSLFDVLIFQVGRSCLPT